MNEALYYNPGLHTKGPEFIKEVLTHNAFVGKDDSLHTRLKQYKLLENRVEEIKHFSNNTEFLKSSNIRIQYIDVTNDNNMSEKIINNERYQA